MSDSTPFHACLLRPADMQNRADWAFVLLPFDVSVALPRRGRVTVTGTFNTLPFQAVAQPDGQKGHWLPLDNALLSASGCQFGDTAHFTLQAVSQEPDPQQPPDFASAIAAHTAALTTWQSTTTLARLDWIHWIESAKQASTRAKRINDACAMLAQGKKRVCCFDSSGFYSKAFTPPATAAE